MNIDKHHADYAKAKAFMEGWDEGFKWAHSLKVSDIFLGAWGEATRILIQK